MTGLFLYNPADLYAKIPGGVQICSKEFLAVVENTVDELHQFEVQFSKGFLFRFLYKLNLDNYLSYQPSKWSKSLEEIIVTKNITHIFINKSELLRFSKLIKKMELPQHPKVIIMSHGNESGDLLGSLSSFNPTFNWFYRSFGIIKLGFNLFTESLFRKRYVDMVCTMSKEESAIEKWLGINNPFFISRLINRDEIDHPKRKGQVFGYVGTLNHTPNIAALTSLFDVIKFADQLPEIRVVGQPEEVGKSLASKYPFVKFLGALSDEELLQEVKSWNYFINPIFYYSRGASMKLAKAITWEIPVITTIAGRRGYCWTEGSLIETENSPKAFANKMISCLDHLNDHQAFVEEIKKIKYSAPTASEQGRLLRLHLQKLTNN